MQDDQTMLGNLLLYLMVSDLVEMRENDLREYLETMLLAPPPEDSEDGEGLLKAIHQQLESDTLDVDAITCWPDEFASLLPACMDGYADVAERFDQVYESVTDEVADNALLRRFRACLSLLAPNSDWQQRSEAARGIGSLEEEVYRLRDQHLAQPFTLAQARPHSVIAFRSILEGVEQWQEAFRLVHRGKLEKADEACLEASRTWRAVERWGTIMDLLLWQASVLGAEDSPLSSATGVGA